MSRRGAETATSGATAATVGALITEQPVPEPETAAAVFGADVNEQKYLPEQDDAAVSAETRRDERDAKERDKFGGYIMRALTGSLIFLGLVLILSMINIPGLRPLSMCDFSGVAHLVITPLVGLAGTVLGYSFQRRR